MRVDSAKFEMLPPDPPAEPWVMRVSIQGEEFEERAMPLVAMVGELTVDFMRVSPDGTSASGLLIEVPPQGAQLKIGYLNDRQLLATEITFNGVEA